jgi:polar amino acid transport system substrate-binding protein
VFGIVGAKTTEVSQIEQLSKYRVGVIRAAFGDPIITEKAPAGTTIRRYEDLSGLLQALLAGQVDVIAENSLVPGVLNRMQPSGEFENKIRFSAGYWGMATQKNQDELLAAINAYLTKVKNDGTLDGLYKRYMNVPMPNLSNN